MRKLLSAVSLLCASVCAMGQGATAPFQPAVTQNGSFLSFATITFCSLPTTINAAGVCQTPITVFKDQALTQPYGSAIQTDGIGYFPPNANTATSLWFTPGTYCYTLTTSNMLSPATNPCTPFSVGATTGTDVSLSSLNKTVYADQQAGVDACAKITTSFSKLPSTGGIIDASGFQGNQTCAAGITFPANKPITLKLGAAAIITGANVAFTVPASGVVCIKGVGPTLGGSGTTSVVSSTAATAIEWDGSDGCIEDLEILNNTGNGLTLTGSGTNSVQHNHFKHLHISSAGVINAGKAGLRLIANSATALVTENAFQSIIIDDFDISESLETSGSQGPTDNYHFGYTYSGFAGAGTAGIKITSGDVNTWVGGFISLRTTGVSISAGSYNMLQGNRFETGATDVNDGGTGTMFTGNSFINCSTSTFAASAFLLGSNGNTTCSADLMPRGLKIGGTLTRKIAGRTCFADQYFGADAGAKMIAAESDSNCSIVDATGFTGAQSGTSTVTATVPLILGTYTYTSSANPAISVGTQSALSGQGMLATIIASSSNTADVVKVPSTSIRWSIHDLQITQPSTRSAGSALRVSGGNGSINNVYLPIFFDGMFFDTAVTAGANMITHFYLGNATDSGTPHCGIRNGGVSSGTVSSNQFENGIILETANYSDAMVCIQDGSDTIMFTNFQAVWDVSHAATVAFHTEVVNAGIEPYDIKCTNCVFEAGGSANVMAFDKIRAFECMNCTASGGLDGIALNGGVSSGGGEWLWIGGKISNNHHHGLNIQTGGIGQITVIGARFGDNGQSTNNTFDDIFNVGAGNIQIIGNEFNTINSVAPTNLPKWNIEIAAGNCGNYTIVGNNYAQSGVSGTLSNGCTAANGLSLDANSGTWNMIPQLLRTPKNVARLASDFTSVNSAALQAITGLSFAIPALATNYSFHCALRFSQATNVAGDQFGVASLTTAPTLLSVDDAKVATGATAVANGNLDGFSTTTPTAFVTFTPGVATQLGATFDGVLEASGSGASTLQFYVLNGTAADLIVVKKDSYCTLTAQ